MALEFSLYALLSYEKIIICSKEVLCTIAVIHDKYLCAWLYSSGSKLSLFPLLLTKLLRIKRALVIIM